MGFFDIFKKKEKKELTNKQKRVAEIENLIDDFNADKDNYEEKLADLQKRTGMNRKFCRTLLARIKNNK